MTTLTKTALAVATGLLLSSAALADDKVKVYGKVNVTLQSDDTGKRETDIKSNASRIGVKGGLKLDNGLKAIYQVEWQVDVADNEKDNFKARSQWVGLKGNFGTVMLGRNDTAMKKSQGKFDLFNDVFDMKNVIVGENRAANSLNYTTEKMGAVQVSASVVFAEDGTSDGYSANATFKADSLYASVAYDTKVGNESTVRATGIYSMGDLSFGALLNQVDSDDVTGDEDELAFGVNTAIKAGGNTYKVQYLSGDQKAEGSESITLGVDHKLAKTTKTYFYINQYETDATDSIVTAALGLEHKF